MTQIDYLEFFLITF